MFTRNVLRRYSFDIDRRSSSVPALGRLRYEARYAHFVPRTQATLIPPKYGLLEHPQSNQWCRVQTGSIEA